MAHTDDMVNITESELEKLVGEDASCVCKAKQTMVCEDCPQPHGSCMQYGLIA